MADEIDLSNDNKFWLAIGRGRIYTIKDKYIFRVWPDAWEKNSSMDLMPKFIEADNLDAARRKAHQFIDWMFGEYVKVDKIHGRYVPSFMPVHSNQGPIPDSITIGMPIVEAPAPKPPPVPPEPKSDNDDLLDLKGLV